MKKSTSEAVSLLMDVHQEFAEDIDKSKLNMSNKTFLKLACMTSFCPEPYVQLRNELLDNGYVLVQLAERIQLFRIEAITRLRKLPLRKAQDLVADNPELAGKPAEIMPRLFESAFNRFPRGPYHASRSDIATICGVKILSPNRVYQLSWELDQTPLLKPRKSAPQGYVLIDAMDVIAIVEKRQVLRNPVITWDQIKDVLGDRI